MATYTQEGFTKPSGYFLSPEEYNYVSQIPGISTKWVTVTGSPSAEHPTGKWQRYEITLPDQRVFRIDNIPNDPYLKYKDLSGKWVLPSINEDYNQVLEYTADGRPEYKYTNTRYYNPDNPNEFLKSIFAYQKYGASSQLSWDNPVIQEKLSRYYGLVEKEKANPTDWSGYKTQYEILQDQKAEQARIKAEQDARREARDAARAEADRQANALIDSGATDFVLIDKKANGRIDVKPYDKPYTETITTPITNLIPTNNVVDNVGQQILPNASMTLIKDVGKEDVKISITSPFGEETLTGSKNSGLQNVNLGSLGIDLGKQIQSSFQEQQKQQSLFTPAKEEAVVVYEDPSLVAMQTEFNKQTSTGMTPIFNQDSSISFTNQPTQTKPDNKFLQALSKVNNAFNDTIMPLISPATSLLKNTYETKTPAAAKAFIDETATEYGKAFYETGKSILKGGAKIGYAIEHPLAEKAFGKSDTKVNNWLSKNLTATDNNILKDRDVLNFGITVGTLGVGTAARAAGGVAATTFNIGAKAAAVGFTGYYSGKAVINPTPQNVATALFVGTLGLKETAQTVKDVYAIAGSKYVPASSIISPKTISGQEPLPLSKGTKYALNEFNANAEAGKIFVNTASPGKIKGLTVEGMGSKPGLEDPGIYVTPKGKASAYFLGFDSNSGYSMSLNPFKNVFSMPTITEFKTNPVTTYPRGVLKTPGFEAVAEFQKANAGKGTPYITKRSMIGQGELTRQKFIAPETFTKNGLRVKAGDVRTEAGTSEIEAVIGLGEKFKYTPKTTLGKVKGFDTYTIYRGNAVPIRNAELITTETVVGKGSRVVSGKRVAAEQKAYSSLSSFEKSISPFSVIQPASYTGTSSSKISPRSSFVSLSPSTSRININSLTSSYKPSATVRITPRTSSYSNSSYKPSTVSSIISSGRSNIISNTSIVSSSMSSNMPSTSSYSPLTVSSVISSPSSSIVSSPSYTQSPVSSIISSPSYTPSTVSSIISSSASSIISSPSYKPSTVSSVISSPTSSIVSSPSYKPSTTSSVISSPSSIISPKSSYISKPNSSSSSYISGPPTSFLEPPPNKKKKKSGFDLDFGEPRRKFGKKKSKYAPSVEAIVFNIKSSKKPRMITGLELRPL